MINIPEIHSIWLDYENDPQYIERWIQLSPGSVPIRQKKPCRKALSVRPTTPIQRPDTKWIIEETGKEIITLQAMTEHVYRTWHQRGEMQQEGWVEYNLVTYEGTRRADLLFILKEIRKQYNENRSVLVAILHQAASRLHLSDAGSLLTGLEHLIEAINLEQASFLTEI